MQIYVFKGNSFVKIKSSIYNFAIYKHKTWNGINFNSFEIEEHDTWEILLSANLIEVVLGYFLFFFPRKQLWNSKKLFPSVFSKCDNENFTQLQMNSKNITGKLKN